MPHHPTSPATPGADASPTIPTTPAQNATAAAAAHPADLVPVAPHTWRALLACGHRVDVVALGDGETPPASVPCPRCGHRQPVEVYPLTALSDPDNVGWVPVAGTDR